MFILHYGYVFFICALKVITTRCAVNVITVGKMANWHWCIGTLQRIVSDLAIYDDGRMIEVDVADAYQVQLELVYREVVYVEILGNLQYASKKPSHKRAFSTGARSNKTGHERDLNGGRTGRERERPFERACVSGRQC